MGLWTPFVACRTWNMQRPTCNEVWSFFFESVWPTKVRVPVSAFISDTRVVRCNNSLHILCWICAILFYFFIFKSYQIYALATTSSNAWMDPFPVTDTAVSDTSFCNNIEYDYQYSDAWTYTNNGCKLYSLREIFIKGLATHVWWINTYFVDAVSDLCDVPNNETRLACQGKTSIPVSNHNTFVLGVEQYPLTIETNIQIPRVNFTKEDSRTMAVYVVHRHTGVRTPLADDLHTGSTISMTIAQWLELAETTLDTPVSSAGSSTATGIVRHRMMGLGCELKQVNTGRETPH